MTFVPNRKKSPIAEGMTALERFRLSPMYRAMMRKKTKGSVIFVQSLHQTKANLKERAESWLYMEGQQDSAFCNALIAKLIEMGLDRAMIEVLDEGSRCTVYMSDRIGKLSKELNNLLAEIAESETVARPEDSGNGLFVFVMHAKEGVDFQAYAEKILSRRMGMASEKVESVFTPKRTGRPMRETSKEVDPSFIPICRKK